MSGLTYINDAIEKKLLDLNVAYVAKVLSVSGTTAKIQPLGMIKQIGETARARAPITNVPIANSARYKFATETISYVTGTTPSVVTAQKTVVAATPLAAGDIVICLCADRDITEAKNGKNSVPSIGHHSISDSIIVGVL